MSRFNVTAVLILLLNAAGWAQFEHPDLKSGKAVVRTAMILPPSIKIVKSGVKGNETLTEESHQVEIALPPLLTSVLQEHQCSVNDKALASDALAKDTELQYAVADLQKRFDEMFPQLERKPKDVRKGRFTMGDEVAKINPGGTVDALVFVRGFGQVNTGGKVFLSAVAGVSPASGIVYYITVVDARSGAVLYYATAYRANPKKPDEAIKSFQKSFKNFPGEGKKKES